MIKRVLPVNHFALDLIFFHLFFGLFIDFLGRLFTVGLHQVFKSSYRVTVTVPLERDFRRSLGATDQLANLTLVTCRLGKRRTLVNLGFV